MRIAYLRFVIAYLSLTLGVAPFPAALNAQKINLDCTWTNGDESLWPGELNDTVVYFFAGNLHEGWFEFCLNLKKIDNLGLYVGGDSCGDLAEYVRVKEINGLQILLVKHSFGIKMYRQGYREETLSKLRVQLKTNHELAGKYVNASTGKTVIFYPDKQKVTGLGKSTEYEFGEEYDMPTEVISFDEKQGYYYDVTEKGLDLFIASKKDEESDWEKGKKVMTLVKTEWLNADSLKNTPGKYPFGSKEILIDGILGPYSSGKLAMIRNEIYARHGMIFKSPSLQKYFSGQSWYKPLNASVEDKLSELEKFNIQLIQKAEVAAKEDEAMRKRDGWQ